MKKISLIFVVLVLLLSSILLTSCGGIKLAKVQEEPLRYVEEGTKLTLSGTVLSPLTEDTKKASLELLMEEEGEDAERFEIKSFLDSEKDTFYGYAKIKTANGLDGASETAEYDLSLWLVEKKLVVKSEMLKDVFGTDSVGIDLATSEEDLKESSLYQLLVTMLGIDGEGANEEDKTVLQAIDAELTEFINKVNEVLEHPVVVEEVKEENVTVEGKEVAAISVKTKVSQTVYDGIFDGAVSLINGLYDALGQDVTVSKEDMAIPEISASTKYYLAKDSGALIREEVETVTATPASDDAEETRSTVSYWIDFGADPTKKFLPAFSFETKTDDVSNLIVTGSSSYEDAKLVLSLSGKAKDEDETVITLSFAADGTFTATSSESEGTVTGTLKSEEGSIILTANIPADEELDEKACKVEMKISTKAEVPALPEYKDILSLTEDDLAGLLESLGLGPVDYAEQYYNELLYYLNVTETELDTLLADYANYGYSTKEDYIYVSYAQCVYQDMITNCGVSQTVLDQYLNTNVDENASFLELAQAMDEAYYTLAFDAA